MAAAHERRGRAKLHRQRLQRPERQHVWVQPRPLQQELGCFPGSTNPWAAMPPCSHDCKGPRPSRCSRQLI
eukprot:10981436-Alexandrium_andersonii.AAC.1